MLSENVTSGRRIKPDPSAIKMSFHGISRSKSLEIPSKKGRHLAALDMFVLLTEPASATHPVKLLHPRNTSVYSL